MKRKLLNFSYGMATILVVLTSLQCSEKKSEPTPAPTCSVTGTLKSNICDVGVWNSYVIVLENGTVLQPYDASEATVAAAIKGFVPKEDMKITFGYEVMKRDTRYDNVILCQALPIYRNTTPIRFTCFK